MTAARQAVAVARALWPDDHPDLANVLGQAADVLARLDSPAAALTLLAEADRINAATLPADTPLAVETKEAMARLNLILGDRAAATALLRLAAEGRKSAAYRANLPQGSATFEMLAWALLDQPQPTEAEVDEAFGALQWTQITRSAEALAMLEQRLSASDPGLAALIRKAQALRLDSDRNRSALLASYAGGTAPQIAALRAQQAGLAQEFTVSEAALTQAGLEMTGLSTVQPMSIAEVQHLLQPDEVMVTFLLPGLRPGVVAGLAQSSNFAVAVTRDAVRFARIPETSRGGLNERITAFRCQIAVADPACGRGAAGLTRGAMVAEPADGTGGFDTAVAQSLYRDLFGGIEPVVGGKAHLILVPPGDLLRLPFQALVTGPEVGGQVPWLLRRHAVSVLPSIPSLRTLRRGDAGASGPGQLLAVGDPVLAPAAVADCGGMRLAALRSGPGARLAVTPDGLADGAALRALPGLPDATCEIRAIAADFPAGATTLLRAEANEARLKQMNADGTLMGYDTLVFSTHGLLAGEAGVAEPGLVLTPPEVATEVDDGLLTASEIASLSVRARLVILSACNTASGDGAGQDGLSGLARAFFQAGARTLMVTHWSVYSRAALQVSTGFVERSRATPGLRPSEALRQTLLGILDAPDSDPLQRQPAYWAAFAIVGAD